MSKSLLKPGVGVLWNELQNFEKQEIILQFKNFHKINENDKLRFRKTTKGQWYITNAMCLPLTESKMVL